jgi:hypothetical protein
VGFGVELPVLVWALTTTPSASVLDVDVVLEAAGLSPVVTGVAVGSATAGSVPAVGALGAGSVSGPVLPVEAVEELELELELAEPVEVSSAAATP